VAGGGGSPVHVFPPFRFSNGTTRQNFAGVLKIKGQSILTGYKSPREWNEPCAWHEINLAHKFPVKTNVPEPRRKLRRPKKQGAFICLPPVRWLLALHTTPPGAWLLLFIYQWIDIFFRITMVCHSFWVYLLKGNYFPKSSGALILSHSGLTQHRKPFITWMSNNARQIHPQLFPLQMEKQKKVQSVESVNDYQVTLCIQGIQQISCAYFCFATAPSWFCICSSPIHATYHPFNQKFVLDNRSDNKVSLKWKEECMVVIIWATVFCSWFLAFWCMTGYWALMSHTWLVAVSYG
jgi:hypothetical protein